MSEGWVAQDAHALDGSGLASSVPEGYKRTEVGVIPKDWSVRSLRSILAEPPSYGINASSVPFNAGLPAYIRITDIGEDGRFRPKPRVSVDSAHISRFFLRAGDLVFARTGASVGKSYLYDPKDGPLVFAGFLIRVTPNLSQIIPEFLAYYVQTKWYWNWIASNSARSGQPGINSREYGSLPVPLPPLPEQKAIASALSDVDELITFLEALIAKKQAIKQATLQLLLTGETRLPGFKGAWETVSIGEIAKIYGGLTGKSGADFGDGGARYVSFLDVLENITIGPRQFDRVRIRDSESQNRVARNDVLFNATSETPDDLGVGSRVDIAEDDLYLNSFCFGVRIVDEGHCDPLFLAYYSRSNAGRRTMYALAQGATRYNLSKRRFLALTLSLPPFPEQQAIATVLSDMDAEITALEHCLNKTRAIKQSMMQELLSGSIRLPVQDDATEGDAHGT